MRKFRDDVHLTASILSQVVVDRAAAALGGGGWGAGAVEDSVIASNMNNHYNGETIIFSDHARDYVPIRGYEPEEVVRAIKEAPWQPAERNRLEVRMDFTYQALWNRKVYETKQVRPSLL